MTGGVRIEQQTPDRDANERAEHTEAKRGHPAAP